MEYRLRDSNPAIALQIRALRKEMQREFGLIAIAAAKLLGPVLWWTSAREEKRLAAGHSYEPATIIDRRNWPAAGASTPRPLAVEPLTAGEGLLRART